MPSLSNLQYLWNKIEYLNAREQDLIRAGIVGYFAATISDTEFRKAVEASLQQHMQRSIVPGVYCYTCNSPAAEGCKLQAHKVW